MIAYAKLGGLLALVLALFGAGFYFGSLRGNEKADAARTAQEASESAQSAAVAKAVLAERASAQAQAITDRAAETQHDKTIESLPARVVRTPVFLRGPGEICSDPAPGGEAKASSDDPGGRRIEQGSGGDIRPAIEAFKLKYETALADCRRLDAEWPK